MRGSDGRSPNALSLVPPSVSQLHPQDAAWDAMLDGWAIQMQSRGLSPATIEPRLGSVRRFMAYTGEYPWQWSAADLDEWSAELLQTRRVSKSTLRSYHGGLRLFCDYLVDPRYGWPDRCLELFGSHPVQVCHEWNTLRHVVDDEARPGVRPLTREEVRGFGRLQEPHTPAGTGPDARR